MDRQRRIELHEILKDILGTNNVYFQPPESLKLKYPCIIYGRDKVSERYADNSIYSHMTRYQVTCVDEDPDSEIPEKIRKLKYCSFERQYAADNLYHDVFTLYY